MQVARRRLLAQLLALPALGAWLGSRHAVAAESALPVPPSLLVAAQEAKARSEPLVLLVSLPGCPFCELVRRNYLLPMRAEGLPAWQIDVHDGKQPVADFKGQRSNGALLASGWKVRVTPTVLFLDAQGTELAPRLEGIAVPDFYGAYLDDALALARSKLRRQP